MHNVSGEILWDAILKDAEFQATPSGVKDAMKPFILALPEVLAADLDKKVSIASLSRAKVKYLRYCIDNGMIKAVLDGMPDDSLLGIDRDDLKIQFEDMLEQAIGLIMPYIRSASAFLSANGVTEEQVLTGPNVGLSGEGLELYRAKQLTIGKYLELYPANFVNNTQRQ